MMRLRMLAARIVSLFRRRRDADLDEEIEAHLSLLADEQLRRGVPAADARAAAAAAFGSATRTKETYRELRGLPLVETLAQDAVYGLRTLRMNPAFTATIVVTLALGIGANTAIFSVIDALMLRTLGVPQPDELITLHIAGTRGSDDTFSYPAFRALVEEGARVAEMVAITPTRAVGATIDGASEIIERQSVSGDFFAVLGVTPAAGRLFSAEEDRLYAAQPVAVLSHGYWSQRFGRNPRIIGRTLTIDSMSFTIVGVAAPGFFGATVGELPKVWTPLTANARGPSDVWTGHGTTWLRLIGRRRNGVTFDETRAVLEPVFGRITREIASTQKIASFRNQALQNRLIVEHGGRGLSRIRARFSGPLQILMAVAGIVLLVACANIANLLLARATVRRREIALRAAIGATRPRLVRQLMVEASLLAVLGGAVGLFLGLWGGKSLAALASSAPMPLGIEIRLDWPLLGFAAVTCAITLLTFGLIPALRAARPDLLPALKESPGPGGASGWRLGKALVAAQIALSFVLLVAAGLFVRSLSNLRSIDLGFVSDRLLVLRIDGAGGGQQLSPHERDAMYERVLERAEAIPGVQSASLSFFGLFSGSSWGNRITVEGRSAPADEPLRTNANAISPRYFETMGMQVLRGRAFTVGDRRDRRPVAIVNETFARQFFAGSSPVGKHVGLGAPAKAMMEIVGVVGDAKYGTLRESPTPMLYVPQMQHQNWPNQFQVRTSADPTRVSAALQRELSELDARMKVMNVIEMGQLIDASIAAERLIARLSALFGALALALSAVGLYGVIAYVSARRSREIGIRVALGADRRTVVWLVLRQVLGLVTAGALLGAPMAFFLTRLIAGQLYELDPYDPATITAALLTLSAAALLAGYLPARRAARLNPVAALRTE